MELNTLLAISPVDGRYRKLTENISQYFSEYAYIKYRLIVEIKWFKHIVCNVLKNEDNFEVLDKIIDGFNVQECEKVKQIEKTTNHDVKAIEYYLKEAITNTNLEKYTSFVHFACTSEDINNLAYNLMINSCLKDIIIPAINELINNVKVSANELKDIAMLGHTHGQPATPTTVGKELAIFAYRWQYILDKIKSIKLKGKCSGAVGNFSAHSVAIDIDWIKSSKEFIESLEMEFNPLVAQIESHDTICELFSYIKLFNNITLDFNSDMWMYISMRYFKQKTVKTETGSSVMPHKVNPINHENSMANIHMANSIIDNFTNNLQISRMQRDLSDSSNLRNIGVMFSHTLISIKQSIIAFSKMELNEEEINRDLENNPEVLAEAIQTVLRKEGYNNAYEILKDFTRGKDITKESLKELILSLNISEENKNKLLSLEPKDYIGLSEKLVNYIN